MHYCFTTKIYMKEKQYYLNNGDNNYVGFFEISAKHYTQGVHNRLPFVVLSCITF